MRGQNDIPPVPPEFLPTIDDLVGVARARGLATATPRTIHGWRDRGIISSEPTRYGTQYRYPMAAIGEVDCQVRWGRRKMAPELLTFARYIEAGTVSSDEALIACRGVLEAIQADAASIELAGQKEVIAQEEGRRAARSRGANAMVPRAVRMSQDDRDAAFTYLFGILLGIEDEVSADDGRFQLERLVGARSGHGGADRDLTELIPPAGEWRLDLDVLHAAVRDANLEAAELARRQVELFTLWYPALLPLLDGEITASEQPFLEVAEATFGRAAPDIYVPAFAWRLTGPAIARPREELAAELQVFQPATIIAEALADSSEHQIDRVRAGLGPYQRVQLLVARRADERAWRMS
jgi:hypothetical protein